MRNITLYYWITFLTSSWFQIGSWAIFALLYINEFQFGIFEAIAFTVGFLLEIPTGAIADLLGKKRTINLGLIILTIGSILFVLSPLSPWCIFIGNLLIIGFAFPLMSGSMEALAYDSLVEEDKVSIYEKVAAHSSLLAVIALIFGSFVGGLLWEINMFLPWIACSVVFAIATILSFFFKEPEVDTVQFSWKSFLEQNKIGLQTFKKKNIRIYLLLFLFLYSAYYMWSTGIIRPIMGTDFGLDGETISYIIGFAYVISALFVKNLEVIRKKLSDIRGFFILLLIISLAYLAAYFATGWLAGLVVFSAFTVTGIMAKPWLSIILNENTESKYRATTLSTVSFATQIPYVLIVLFYGKMAQNGNSKDFYLGAGIFLIVALMLLLFYKLRNNFKALSQS